MKPVFTGLLPAAYLKLAPTQLDSPSAAGHQGATLHRLCQTQQLPPTQLGWGELPCGSVTLETSVSGGTV